MPLSPFKIQSIYFKTYTPIKWNYVHLTADEPHQFTHLSCYFSFPCIELNEMMFISGFIMQTRCWDHSVYPEFILST